MNPAELIMNKRNTRAFIVADGTWVQFQRTEDQVLPNGGVGNSIVHTTEPILVRKFTGKLRLLKPATTTTSAGYMNRQYERLIAEADADIQVKDTFEFDGKAFQVTRVDKKAYEVIVEVELRGDDSTRRS